MNKTRIIEVINEEYGYGKVHFIKSKHIMPVIHHGQPIAPTYTTVCDEQFNRTYPTGYDFNFDGKNMKSFSKCKKCFKDITD